MQVTGSVTPHCHPLPCAPTSSSPTGRSSTTTIGADVAFGPLLVTVISKTARSSSWSMSSLTMSRSTSGDTIAGSVAVLLSVRVSSEGLLTDTVLVTPG